MAAKGSGAPFEILSRLFGRVGGVLRLVLNTQLQMAKVERAVEAERAGRVAKFTALGLGLLAMSLVLIHGVAVAALWTRTSLPPDAVFGIVFGADLVFGLIFLNRAAAAANEREWMIDTRTRAAETLEILRG